MMNELEMSIFGEMKFFVGLQINQLKNGNFITQFNYVKEMQKTFGMEDSKLVRKLSQNDESPEVNQTFYRSMIGKLQYVVHSRLDIALVIGIVARFSTNPK